MNDYYRPMLAEKSALISEAQNVARELEAP
jgi:hypothetical protein